MPDGTRPAAPEAERREDELADDPEPMGRTEPT